MQRDGTENLEPEPYNYGNLIYDIGGTKDQKKPAAGPGKDNILT